MIKLLTINSEHESAKRMGLPTKIDEFSKYIKSFGDDIIVRWGNSRHHYNKYDLISDFPNVINPACAIRLNCDKYRSSVELSKVVTVPKIFKEQVPNGITAVVRSIEHASGSDFKVKTGKCDLMSGQYATEFIKTSTEIRVWFCGGATLAAKRVPLRNQENGEHPCRSLWGYHFCYKQVPEILHRETLAASRAIGLDFGAADILVARGRYYFLELNSAPTIDKMRLENFYKINLIKLMKKKFGHRFAVLAEESKMREKSHNFFDIDLD